jgi:hypothetical protein
LITAQEVAGLNPAAVTKTLINIVCKGFFIATTLKIQLYLLFVFFEAHVLFLTHDSTCHSLYPRPKAWDAAAVRAKISHLYFHN